MIFLVNSILSEVVVISMQHSVPAPGQPVTINPVTVAAEGIVAAALTIPAMWIFAGAFVPEESARRLRKLFRFLAMLPFTITLALVRWCRRNSSACGRRFALLRRSSARSPRVPDATAPPTTAAEEETPEESSSTTQLPRGLSALSRGLSSRTASRKSSRSLAAEVEEARERVREDSLNALRALSLTRVMLHRPIECAPPYPPSP